MHQLIVMNKYFNKKIPFNLVAGVLFVFAYLCPYHLHPFRSYYNDGFVILGALVLLFDLTIRPTVRFKFASVSLLPFFLILVILLQALTLSPVVGVNLLFPCLYLALAGVSIIIGATICSDEAGQKSFVTMLAVVFFIVGLISVVMQLVQAFALNFAPFVMYMGNNASFARPYANIAQPNQLALILCFGLAANYYIFQIGVLNAKVVIATSAFLLTGLVLTQSRIGWLIVPTFFVLLWQRSPQTIPVRRTVLIILSTVYLLMVLALPFIIASFGVSGGSIAEHVGGRSERSVLWEQAWHMASVHPWLGIGWFGFGAEQVRIAADFGSSTYAEHAHNIILNFAAEMGWPITLLVFVSLTWWFFQACLFTKQTADTRFASLCLIAVTVHSMVEFPMWYAYILLPVSMLMGMLHHQRWPGRGIIISRKLSITVLVSVIISLAAMTWDYFHVIAGFNVFRAGTVNTEVGIKALQKPSITFYPEFFEYFKLMQIEPREGMSANDIAYVEKWTPRFGFVHILNKLAEIDVLNGETQKAATLMQTLQRLHPNEYPEYYDYWKAKGAIDPRYEAVFVNMPKRDAP